MFGVTVDYVVVVDSEFKVIAEGVEETSFYEGCRSSLNTRFGLEGEGARISTGFITAINRPLPVHQRSPRRQRRAGSWKGETWGRWSAGSS